MAEAENPLIKYGKVIERFFDVSATERLISSALSHRLKEICKKHFLAF